MPSWLIDDVGILSCKVFCQKTFCLRGYFILSERVFSLGRYSFLEGILSGNLMFVPAAAANAWEDPWCHLSVAFEVAVASVFSFHLSLRNLPLSTRPKDR